jgi:SRSO17 transposase
VGPYYPDGVTGHSPRPRQRTSKDPKQALQQFVNQSPWDGRAVLRRYRATLVWPLAGPNGVFLIDDASFPKQGGHAVGVQRQYCRALGKETNCRVAVSVHHVGPKGPFPLDLRLYQSKNHRDSPVVFELPGLDSNQDKESQNPFIGIRSHP